MYFLEIEGILTNDASLIKGMLLIITQIYLVMYMLNMMIGGDIIPFMVDPAYNTKLVSIPDWVEIKILVFEMDGSSAPGPYGFSWDFLYITRRLLKRIFFGRFMNFSLLGVLSQD